MENSSLAVKQKDYLTYRDALTYTYCIDFCAGFGTLYGVLEAYLQRQVKLPSCRRPSVIVQSSRGITG